MSDFSKQHDPEDLPHGLTGELRGLFSAPVPVPGRVDERILRDARVSLHGGHRWKLAVWIGGVAAAAAVFAVVLRVATVEREWGPQANSAADGAARRPGPSKAGIRDINRDGQVNIIDAYLLARRVERERELNRVLDFNADGVVDRKDADRIAVDAVRLDEGGVR